MFDSLPHRLLVAGTALFMLLAANSAWAQEPSLSLTRGGKAQAVIILGASATPTEQLAAQELQQAVQLISGAELPIAEAPSGDSPARLVLGTPATSRLVADHREAFADDLAFLQGSDGFAVRRLGDAIYIFAAEPKGVLNGVYSFLEENTSIIWFRAGEDGVAYQPSQDLTAAHADYRERPALDLRGWFLTAISGHTHPATEQWMIRNRANYKPASRNDLQQNLASYRERGLHSGFGGGHNFKFWFPDDPNYQTHPEYFAMIDGVRRPFKDRSQLCYSNLDGAQAFAQAVLGKLSQVPEGIDEISILFEDNWSLCQCGLCTEPLRLPDGTTLDPEDEAFRSTQYFGWLNHVAEQIYAHRPEMKIDTYGYFFTTTPPKIAVFPTIHIRFCPIVRSDKHALQTEINQKWVDRLEGWLKAVSPEQLVIREYYGCATHFPRPISPVVAADLQYFHKLGIQSIFAETPPDANKSYGDQILAHRWDASSMQYWLITRLYWNPYADVDALRQRYLDRVYGPAASAMGRFHELIHEAWYASNAAEYYNATSAGMAERYIKAAGIEDACRAALEDASRSTSDEKVKARVATMRDRFEAWMALIAEHPRPTATVPVASTDVSQILDFDSAAWSDAGVIDGLSVMKERKTPARHLTTVRLLHDEQRLYLGILCADPDGEIVMPDREHAFEQFPPGDRIELFIVGDQEADGLYYQLAFNAAGVQYDGVGWDKAWNGDWSVVTRVDADGWRAVASIPWSTLGIDPGDGAEVAALIYRFAEAPTKAEQEHSSWNGGSVHVTSEFGRLILE